MVSWLKNSVPILIFRRQGGVTDFEDLNTKFQKVLEVPGQIAKSDRIHCTEVVYEVRKVKERGTETST